MRAASAVRGFTLVEIIIVLAISGILVSALVPLGELAVQRAKERELRTALREVRTALDTYKRIWDEGRLVRQVGESGYPPSLDILVDGVVDTRSPDKRRIYLLRRLPRDPFADPSLPAAATWGRRSYESPPESPAEGRDVFDVYSRAPGVGMNGIPYRQW
jgi:general secretion pathway protein G